MERTHHNGELSLKNLNEDVVLVGWVSKKRNLGSLLFIDLRDRSGIVQITVREGLEVPDIRNEYVIQVYGKVAKKDVPNKNLKTGEIEVIATKINLINKAEVTPMIIDDKTDALEDTRLKYRYLDLRRPIIQKYLMTRAKIVQAVHEYLDNNGFIEVETPTLTLSTPEGARDYLVPSRIHHGCFYALPQSPQIFKQLLMIGGFERYYQVARCYRDEDLRADRQPEFTQIDLEMSFMDQEQVLTMVEGLLANIFKKTLNIDLSLPLRRIPYDEATSKYGSDKPDTRFGFLIQDIKEVVKDIDFGAFKNEYVKAVVIDNYAKETSRKDIDNVALEMKKFNLPGILTLKFIDNELQGSITKYLSENDKSNLIKALSLKDNDMVFIAASNNKRDVLFGLGALRSMYAKKLDLIKPNTYDLLWVTRFPLFERKEDGSYTSEHHPFTRPCEEDMKYLDTDPSKVYSQAYDIVINGYEAGGGSLRIYERDLQQKIFEILGLTEEDIKRKFGFFIDAFKYGTPPHAGLAFGLDRLAMIIGGTDNIRDVIAFPKNLAATCPMSNAPGIVDIDQLNDLGIEIKK